MKSIQDEIIEIQIRKMFKCLVIIFTIIALLYFAAGTINGIQSRPYKEKAQAYAADVQRAAQWVERQR